ncbi:DUF4815 domain-containing protein [Agrobacterium vitis]|uniref:DUF4815 domain-containing protein n=1 Tax=Agrobacterium vitis TaxID=373 RepID=UPI001F1D2620|nr:DUF4815 domain-containing protein [Agrobacterium vitis]MCF1453401.1 DUF4815 domain-containing protein [Agrobacterium vitis]
MTTNVFDTGTYPDLANVHDRSADRPDIDRVYFGEGDFAQAADINEAFSIEEKKRSAIGDLVASDGDRLSGADIVVDVDAGTVLITQGSIYLKGAPRSVDARTLTGVAMAGDVSLGVRVVTSPLTAADDSIFYGLVSGTEGYGEEGAVRTNMAITWATATDGGEGDFYSYAMLRDGSVISQDAPPTLTGVQKQIGTYDYDAHGNYVVRGCVVTALGKTGSAQVFSVGAGVCNVQGTKVTRGSDNRLTVTEEPDVASVSLEGHTFASGGTGTVTITVRRPPIAAIEDIVITRQKTVTLSKGVGGSSDALPDTGVVSIISVVQLSTTYVVDTDYIRSGDSVNWSPAGAEPATGSSYQVTYRYYDNVVPDNFTSTTIVVSGGVDGTDMFLEYSYKLPRYDRILISSDGSLSYLKGISSVANPHAPAEPEDALSLCTVQNDWYGTPVINNDATRAIGYKRLNYLQDRLSEVIDLVLIERLKSDANARSAGPTLGVFTDPLWDDSYRDFGVAQTAAVFDGSMQVAIDADVRSVRLADWGLLDYSEEVVVSQELYTACEKINPYQNFNPVPFEITIDPSTDYWTETQTVSLSAVTQVFGSGNESRVRSSTVSSTTTSTVIAYLRQIDIGFEITGMGGGENVSGLTFDGLDVNPGGIVADVNGKATGTFQIPANVSAGTKKIEAVGGAGLSASATFRGEGRLETTTTQTTTVIERFSTVTVTREHESGGHNSSDPQAQSYALTEGRYITSLDVKFCAIGTRSKPVDVDFVEMENGFPTNSVFANKRIDMNSVATGGWTKAALDCPVYNPADTYLAFKLRTDDASHSIGIATLGDFDSGAQAWVTSQPYTIGDRFSGSNNESWLLHPSSDISFKMRAAVFSPITKSIAIGDFVVADVSDILIRSDVILPESSCSVVFQVKVPKVTDGVTTYTTYTVSVDQTLELDYFATGTVTITAVLSGTSKVSPLLNKDVTVIFGTMRAMGDYVGRSFTMGSGVELNVVFSGLLPNGSTVAVSADANDGTFAAASLSKAEALDDGWVEYTYKIASHAAPDGGRLKLVLTGTPAARPAIADLRAWTF